MTQTEKLARIAVEGSHCYECAAVMLRDLYAEFGNRELWERVMAESRYGKRVEALRDELDQVDRLKPAEAASSE